METIPFDSTATLKRLAGTKACRPELVEIPEFSFPMIDGQGSPDETEFATAIETLEGLAWTIRFAHKRAGFGPVYSVPPLEGLYHVDNWSGTFRPKNLDQLIWTPMIAQPPPVATVHLEPARGQDGFRPKETWRDPSTCSPAEPRGRALCAGTSHRSSDRICDHRTHSRLFGGERADDARPPSRNLPRGSTPGGARDAENVPAMAGLANRVNVADHPAIVPQTARFS